MFLKSFIGVCTYKNSVLVMVVIIYFRQLQEQKNNGFK